MSKHFTGHYYTAAALQSAYRDLCMDHHPDRANQVMQEINGEYEILKEQLKRDGAAGWNVPKDIKQDKSREPIKQDVKPAVNKNVDHSEYDADIAAHARQVKENHTHGWTWEEKHAENCRAADEEMQRIFNSGVLPL